MKVLDKCHCCQVNFSTSKLDILYCIQVQYFLAYIYFHSKYGYQTCKYHEKGQLLEIRMPRLELKYALAILGKIIAVIWYGFYPL